jgi:hypothetical protein
MTIAKEISENKLDLVGEQEAREKRELAPNQQAEVYFSMKRGMRIKN